MNKLDEEFKGDLSKSKDELRSRDTLNKQLSGWKHEHSSFESNFSKVGNLVPPT